MTVLAAVVAGLAAGVGWRAQRAAAEIQQALSAPPPPVTADPSAHLPTVATDGAAERWVADLHRSAQGLQLTIRDYSLEPGSAASPQDGPVDLIELRGSLNLQGRYADLKQLLREAAARSPGFTITRLELTRSAGTDDAAPQLDASVSFVLLRLPKPPVAASQSR